MQIRVSVTPSLWQRANRLLTAKILAELMFEEVLSPVAVAPAASADSASDDSTRPRYLLSTANRNYYFAGQMSIWGMLVIDPSSIQVAPIDQDGALTSQPLPPDACQLLIDIQPQLAINAINLSGLLEEVQQTLYSDCVYLQRLQGVTAASIAAMSDVTRQAYLSAHPKAIANKGRLGWGADDLARYAPESGATLRLRCIAVHRSVARSGVAEGLNMATLWQESIGQQAWRSLQGLLADRCQRQGTDAQGADFLLMPVHPWQLQRFLQAQFSSLFASGQMLDLGDIPGEWIPQQSIRTLSAADARARYDIKTAITILNTSCYRGIPGSFILHGPRLSRWLADTVASDPLLSALDLRVQQEVAGLFCDHPYQQQVAGGAYRYQEMLGCIWRERAERVIPDGTRVMAMATLLQVDSRGDSCVAALIHASGLCSESWLRRLFRHVVVPLYHLMCQYGVGLVAHGQNISVILRQNQPVGCLIKDFHGDLRLIDQDFPELQSLDSDICHNVTRLPAHYLIHDLVTGHFVTVLRFVSPLLISPGVTHAVEPVSETAFYQCLADEIRQYQGDHPQLAERFQLFDLFSDTIAKVCVNRVRFAIGYHDSDTRPLPELGTPIDNPLLVASREQ